MGLRGITSDEIVSIDASGKFQWVNDEMRAWFYDAFKGRSSAVERATDAYFAEEKESEWPFTFEEPTPASRSKSVRVGNAVFAKVSRWVAHSAGGFQVDGLRPIGTVEIRALDAAGKFKWVSSDMRDWFFALPAVEPARSPKSRARDTLIVLLITFGFLVMGAFWLTSIQTSDSVVGTWRSRDGKFYTFHPDGTYSTGNWDAAYSSGEVNKEYVYEGVYELTSWQGRPAIKLTEGGGSTAAAYYEIDGSTLKLDVPMYQNPQSVFWTKYTRVSNSP